MISVVTPTKKTHTSTHSRIEVVNNSNFQLPIGWYPLRHHDKQQAAWTSKKRFISLVAGRGSGKTELARRKLVISLAYKKPWPNPIYVYCAPTYQQAKKIGWNELLKLIPSQWIEKDGINKSESRISTIFGSTLYVVGMDKPHRMEGLQIDGIVIDESSDQRPELFRKTVIPMLTHRQGWCWRIGVPKKSGIGRVDFRSFFENGLDPTHPTQASYTWKSSEILTPDQIKEAKEQLDPQEYAEQFDAEWVDSGGTIYYNFSRSNITDGAIYNPSRRIIVGCDFNVSPMCWTLAHQLPDISFKYDEESGKLIGTSDKSLSTLVIFDEIFLKDTNTIAALNFLHSKYGINHQGEWTFIGDASARTRKTSATRSDYLIIKNDILS